MSDVVTVLAILLATVAGAAAIEPTGAKLALAAILDGISTTGIWVTVRCITWRDRLAPPPALPPEVEQRITANVMAAVSPIPVVKHSGQIDEKLTFEFRPSSRDRWMADQAAARGVPMMFVEATDGGHAVCQYTIREAPPS